MIIKSDSSTSAFSENLLSSPVKNIAFNNELSYSEEISIKCLRLFYLKVSTKNF